MITQEEIKDQFSGDGANTSFAVTKKIFLDSSGNAELYVVKTDTSNVDTTLTLDSDYTVVLNTDQDANPGGTLTYPVSGSALASGEKLTVVSDPAFTQKTDLISQGRWNPNTVEQMVDRAVSNAIRGFIDSLKLPVSDAPARSKIIPNAATRADKYLKFDSNGDPAVSVLATTGAATSVDPTSSDATADKLVANNHINWALGKKGADIASAATIDLDNMTGDFCHITGTTGITAFSNGEANGRLYTFVFDGALTITHHASNLILPGSSNITTTAGDVLQIRREASGQVRCIFYQKSDGGVVKSLVDADISSSAAITTTKLGSGAIVQAVSVTYAGFASGTTVMPNDNTIPQITEGDQFMSLAITPKNASNTLLFFTNSMLASSASPGFISVALFQDSAANALAAIADYSNVSNQSLTIPLNFSIVAGTVLATTFKIRAGATSAGTTSFNGASGALKFSTAAKSSMIIMEVAA